MTASRMTTGNATSVSCVTAKAASGAAKASAPATAARIASTAHGDVTPPSAAAMARNAVADSVVRNAIQLIAPV